jgi:hypothetical protein
MLVATGSWLERNDACSWEPAPPTDRGVIILDFGVRDFLAIEATRFGVADRLMLPALVGRLVPPSPPARPAVSMGGVCPLRKGLAMACGGLNRRPEAGLA